MTDKPMSPELRALYDEAKPLGEWLRKHSPVGEENINRAAGRMSFAKKNGYDALKVADKEWDEKYKRFSYLQNKIRQIKKKEMKFL